MKTVKLILGVLAALWTVGVIVGFVQDLASSGPRGAAPIAAGLAAIAVCAALTAWLFQSALRKQ